MASESKRHRIERMHDEYRILCEEFPAPACALYFTNPFELLTATILSAQTTDKRVNTVTPSLFSRYPGPAELAAARVEDVEDIIRPLGFYHAKSRNIVAMAHDVHERFGDTVPHTMDELTSLPGVGRKKK